MRTNSPAATEKAPGPDRSGRRGRARAPSAGLPAAAGRRGHPTTRRKGTGPSRAFPEPCRGCNRALTAARSTAYNPGADRGCSSAGRALRSHRRGQGFESPHLHHHFPPAHMGRTGKVLGAASSGGSFFSEKVGRVRVVPMPIRCLWDTNRVHGAWHRRGFHHPNAAKPERGRSGTRRQRWPVAGPWDAPWIHRFERSSPEVARLPCCAISSARDVPSRRRAARCGRRCSARRRPHKMVGAETQRRPGLGDHDAPHEVGRRTPAHGRGRA